jgi:prepilin-type N-terminal cleavage/methylation domain-containing protein
MGNAVAACNPRRRAFTLIEILTVVLIISLLLGMIVAAVGPARNKVKTWRMQSEIKNLELAVERVRSELGGGEYPPDGADISANYADSMRFLRRAFPRANYTYGYDANGVNVTVGGTTQSLGLRPDTALCFWLGGLRGPDGSFIGFNADPTDPFNITNPYVVSTPPQGRIGPFFDFDRTRVSQAVYTATSGGTLSGSAGQYPATTVTSFIGNAVFFPQNDQVITYPTLASTTTQPMPYSPYLYFKAVMSLYSDVSGANEYYHYWTEPSTATQSGSSALTIVPFKNSQIATPLLTNAASATTAERGWINPTTFQILCPGLDGYYDQALKGGAYLTGSEPNQGADANTHYAPIYPDGVNYGPNSKDDVTNFSGGKLQNDMP